MLMHISSRMQHTRSQDIAVRIAAFQSLCLHPEGLSWEIRGFYRGSSPDNTKKNFLQFLQSFNKTRKQKKKKQTSMVYIKFPDTHGLHKIIRYQLKFPPTILMCWRSLTERGNNFSMSVKDLLPIWSIAFIACWLISKSMNGEGEVTYRGTCGKCALYEYVSDCLDFLQYEKFLGVSSPDGRGTKQPATELSRGQNRLTADFSCSPNLQSTCGECGAQR